MDEAQTNLLWERMKALQCPFTWEIPRSESDRALKLIETQSEDDRRRGKRVGPGHALTLCFEYARRAELGKAFSAWHEWVDNAKTTHTFENAKGGSVCDFEYTDEIVSSEGYKHVMQACECFLHFQAQHFSEAEKLSEIAPLGNMTCTEEAIVYYLESDTLKNYGSDGLDNAISKIAHSVRLAPHLSLLHYQYGRLLAKRRRMTAINSSIVLEVKALQRAAQETESPAIMVVLARSLHEFGRLLERYGRGENGKYLEHRLYQKALDQYGNLLSVPIRDVKADVINMRCAEGVLRLAHPYRHLQVAKIFLERAFETGRSDDSLLNHLAAKFCMKNKNYEYAERFFVLATNDFSRNYRACTDLMKLRKRKKVPYSCIPDVYKMLVHLNDDSRLGEIICTLGVYYYFERNDFRKALEYWSEVIRKNIKCRILKVFNAPIGDARRINIICIIVTEFRKLMAEERITENEKDIYDQLLSAYPILLPGGRAEPYLKLLLANMYYKSNKTNGNQFSSTAESTSEDRLQGPSNSSASEDWRSRYRGTQT